MDDAGLRARSHYSSLAPRSARDGPLLVFVFIMASAGACRSRDTLVASRHRRALQQRHTAGRTVRRAAAPAASPESGVEDNGYRFSLCRLSLCRVRFEPATCYERYHTRDVQSLMTTGGGAAEMGTERDSRRRGTDKHQTQGQQTYWTYWTDDESGSSKPSRAAAQPQQQPGLLLNLGLQSVKALDDERVQGGADRWHSRRPQLARWGGGAMEKEQAAQSTLPNTLRLANKRRRHHNQSNNGER
ncbi:hypothetical protein SKAU_G00023860 [Synaphobranchus kaupii]|uniref:Uncharacterized protein n=1 Tax=Synaphobranchus kaupii TaxID=118154 RepID=A0A9Q1GDC9_SYNKA|nr:hypothetical protein SKAU_G00023860 [Synaphobranchus kaupii]